MQTDREAFNEFFRGGTFVLAILATFLLVVAIIGKPEEEPQQKFKVVDTYKGCDIVRYTDPSNRWNYFLDCNGTNH